MKILITGIGSIGQRHYRNLVSLGHEVAVLRSGRPNTDHIQTFINEQAAADNPIREYTSVHQAVEDFAPQAVFITNPNSAHIDIALQCAKVGLHLFIEKPVTHTLEGVEELHSLVEEKNLVVMIGYNLRWHPLLMKMKQQYESGSIGKAVAAHVEMGEYMGDWHPWEDYLETYAPYKDGGGGAVLCFSHDIDYLYWFFGMPERIHAVGGRLTTLGGDAEDMVKVICSYKDNLISSIHLDYWQRPKRRSFEIIGLEGRLVWDYEAGTLERYGREDNDYNIERVADSYDRNDTFIAETEAFINAIEAGGDIPIPLQEGIDVLQWSLNIKEQIGF